MQNFPGMLCTGNGQHSQNNMESEHFHAIISDAALCEQLPVSLALPVLFGAKLPPGSRSWDGNRALVSEASHTTSIGQFTLLAKRCQFARFAYSGTPADYVPKIWLTKVQWWNLLKYERLRASLNPWLNSDMSLDALEKHQMHFMRKPSAIAPKNEKSSHCHSCTSLAYAQLPAILAKTANSASW